MKGQTDMTPKDEPPGLKVLNTLLGKSRELPIAPEWVKWFGAKQLWMDLVMKVKPDQQRTVLYRNLEP